MDEEKKTAECPGCFYCLNVRPFLRRAWSEATQDHFRTARMEFLKGVRSMLDERIANLSRQESKGTHVTVE